MRVLAFLTCLFLTTAADPATAGPVTADTITAAEAVKAAAADPDFGKRGSFGMLVRATGKSHGHVYLNSEVDYRDPRNLSIDIDVGTAKRLARQLGSPPDEFYKGKWIVVRGTARRVPIMVSDEKGPLGKYYQTHVPVRLLSQITVVSEQAAR